MTISIFPAQPATIAGTVTLTVPSPPLPVELPAVPTDDDGNPYVSLYPDSDPPTGSAQEAMRRLLAQIATFTAPQDPPVLTVGQITATQQLVGPFTLNGANMVQVFMTGTYTSATMVWEVSQDGILWRTRRSVRDTGLIENINGIALGANAIAASAIDVSGWLYFRARANAFGAAGILNITVAIYGSFTTPITNATVSGIAALGAAPTGNPLVVAGIDGGGLSRYISTDATGQLNVIPGAGANPWPVTGPATDAQMRASPIPVTGSLTTVPSTQPTTVAVDGQNTDDDGNPYVSLWPDSDPPTGSAQETQRQLLTKLGTGVQPLIPPTYFGLVQTATDIVGPFPLLGAQYFTVVTNGAHSGITGGPQVSVDGIGWSAVRSIRAETVAPFNENPTYVLAVNERRINITGCSGFNYVRWVASAYTSGACEIRISPSYVPPAIITALAFCMGRDAEGAASSGTPVRVSGQDAGGLVRTLLTDTNGSQIINNVPATATVTGTAAISTGVTLTIPAAGVGLFNYLVALEISLYVSTSVTGAATPVAVTSSGITGTPSYSIASGTSAVVGALLDRLLMQFSGIPLKGSAANTTMVFTAPAVTGAIWRINAYYYTGP